MSLRIRNYFKNLELHKKIEQQKNEIDHLRKIIQKLEKRERMLTKNNAKKRRLLNIEEMFMGWEFYQLSEQDEERYQQMENCWESSDESSGEEN